LPLSLPSPIQLQACLETPLFIRQVTARSISTRTCCCHSAVKRSKIFLKAAPLILRSRDRCFKLARILKLAG